MAEQKYPKPMMPPAPPAPMPVPAPPTMPKMKPKEIPKYFPPMPAPTPPPTPAPAPMPMPMPMPMPVPMPTPVPVMPMVDFHQICMLVRPAVKHGCREWPKTGPKHALTEVAMIAYLMGMGYPYQVALMMVEGWEHSTMYPYREEF